MSPLSKTPFLFLLVSLALGIILQYIIDIKLLSMIFIPLGIFIMLFSFLPSAHEFELRWTFGAGVFFSLVGVGIWGVSIAEKQYDIDFTGESRIYRGIIESLPQDKPYTQAYRVQLADENKYIMSYFSYDALPDPLHPGDEFLFLGEIQPFRNAGNPDDFDYARYMYDKGYSGFVFIRTDKWLLTGRRVYNIYTYAERCREYVLDQYKSFRLKDNEYAILAALTLGYQDALSDDLKESFKNTGTAHVLSVSGLHVGIIYMAIGFLFGFLPKRSRLYWIRLALIFIILVLYAFITGLSPAVVRAVIMLSMVCFAQLFRRKGFSFNTLFIAGFIMLLINPLTLFDVGFQLSFSAVFAILYLYPKFISVFAINNELLRGVWQLFSVSLAAQVGTFPLCLYYFGTFPVYFFVANMLIVPLSSFVLYSGLIILIIKLLVWLLPFFEFLYHIPVFLLQSSVKVMTWFMNFIEDLPHAMIEGISISLGQLLLIYCFIISLVVFFVYKKKRAFIIALITLFSFLCIEIYMIWSANSSNELIVYNRKDKMEIKYKTYCYDQIRDDNEVGYILLNVGAKKLLILNRNGWINKIAASKIELDYLLLAGDNTYSVYSLSELFVMNQLILDVSLSDKTRKRLVNESQKLGIPCYDMTQKGAYRTIF